MKKLMYLLILVMITFSVSCSDEENSVTPAPSVKTESDMNKADLQKPADLICGNPNIQYLYTSTAQTGSMTIESSSYMDYWKYSVTSLKSNGSKPWEVWFFIDGKLIRKDAPTNEFDYSTIETGLYTITGYGVHTLEVQAKNHCEFNSVSDLVKKTYTITLHDPLIPYATVITRVSNALHPSIKWNAVKNATSYKIYKSFYNRDDVVVINTTALSYTGSELLYKGTDFIKSSVEYRVTAVGPHGESPYSNMLAFQLEP